MSDSDLSRALVYLLLQVAWADHEVSDEEIEHLTEVAGRLGFPSGEMPEIRAFLRGEKALPAPDIGYLREHRDQALVAVGEMMASDAKIVDDEKQIFDQIRDMLS